MELRIERNAARIVLAQVYRFVKTTAGLFRNAGQPISEILPKGSVVRAESASKYWRVATPLSVQRAGDRALDAQVHLWIQRNSVDSERQGPGT